MIRNREFRILLFVMGLIGLLMTGIGFYYSFWTGIFISLITIALLVCVSLFTLWRYREIEKLTKYLRDISSGNFTLDVRDNEEGELSILKNEIYKVTNILSEYSSHVKRDQVHLTNAISDISHQIKTPLTSMTVMADLLETPSLPYDKRIEFTQNIQTQLERLDWLVSSLLKLAKIDEGTVVFKKEQILINDFIQQSLKTVSIPIDMKEITVQIRGNEKTSFQGDYYWTKEAVINILKNCVEHTPKGGSIDISFAENPLYTEIMIQDTGQGIPRSDLQHIFTRFYKGKHASEESVGIGLAMAHRIITSQNGDIEVDSKENKGTQFVLKFYRKQPATSEEDKRS